MASLDMIFWDVQHGSAAYIKTPNNKHIVHDLGVGCSGSNFDRNRNFTFSPLQYLRNRWGITYLDYLIITHPHKDHIEDISDIDYVKPHIFNRPRHLNRDVVMQGVRYEDRYLFDKYFEYDREYVATVSINEDVKYPENYGGAKIEFFYPTRCSTSNLNNHSIVTVMSFAECKILLPGDNEAPSWRELLERNDFRESIRNTDILLASHHGREAGFCEDVFKYFKPKLTIISDGPDGGTSAIDKYRAQSSGWVVHKRSGGQETRYCVTTRRDGVVIVKFGYNDKDSFIEITID